MATEKSVSDVLSDAADLLMRTGWCRYFERRTFRSQERYCAMGAIEEVVRPTRNWRAAHNAYRCLVEIVGAPVASWNDVIAKNRTEVVAKLREAAAKAKAEGR